MTNKSPGIFAAGDVAGSPDKLKLIVSGLGEAAMAVNHAKVYISCESKSFPGHSSKMVPRQRKEKSGDTTDKQISPVVSEASVGGQTYTAYPVS